MSAGSSLIRFTFLLSVALFAVSVSGARKKTDVKSDVDSTAYAPSVHGDREAYQKRMREPNKHINKRLRAYFVLGGVLQAISEEAQIPRKDIVVGGASRFQDQSSGLGNQVHAAHVIRVGPIDTRLKQRKPALNKALENYVGHTQNVEKEVNVWHGVGGDIDRFQSGNLGKLAEIDFTREYDAGNRLKMEALVADLQNVLNKYVNNEQSVLQADMLEEYLDPSSLFSAGKHGYQWVKDGEFVIRWENSTN